MAVTQAEVACLVHSWLIQQGFSKTASTFVIEAKHHLQTISVNGTIRSLEDILSDYAQLKEADMQKKNMQKVFLADDENKEIFIDIWESFNQLLDDYKYYKSNQHKQQYEPTNHNKRKRRRLSDCNDFNQYEDDKQNLFELNPGRFNEILNNKALHEKMAQLISTQFNEKSNNQNQTDLNQAFGCGDNVKQFPPVLENLKSRYNE